MLQDSTEGAEAALAEGPVTAYIGFDPTAASLHVGNLVHHGPRSPAESGASSDRCSWVAGPGS